MNHRRIVNSKAWVINTSLTVSTYFTLPTDLLTNCEISGELFKNFNAKFKILK
jgi:hypothetical protein